MAIHTTFPKEMAVVGRLLVAYGELEVDLMNCIQVARKLDLNATLKAMFRVRGETSRIDIADGLGRAVYVAAELAAEFDALITASRHCLRIRNKYAHAYWHDPEQGKHLCYVSLEELAKEPGEVVDLKELRFFYLDEGLLLQQETFFNYTTELINHMNFEGQYRSGIIKRHIFALPKVVAPPPYFTRVK